jgi:hypothetical protein
LVLGIGRAETEDPNSKTRRQLIGFATCVLSNGIFLNTSFFPPANTNKQFLSHIEQGLSNMLDNILTEHPNVARVTVHVSRFESHETISILADTIRCYEQRSKFPIPFELVRLTQDSDFSVYDLSHPGYVSEEGTIVALGQDHALIVTEGRREKAVWRGRKPVTLEMHREYFSSPSLQLKDTIEDAFYLSSVNWRGFNVITQPITLQYSRLLIQQVAKMSRVIPDICTYIKNNDEFSSVPWFI